MESVEFSEIAPAAGFDIPSSEAIKYFQSKGLRPSFSYADLFGEEHDIAFTVAKIIDIDLLADVKASLDRAVADGLSFRDWADQLIPELQAKGWWGRQEVVDPLTGIPVVAQLGSSARLDLIFRTNLAGAYSNGHWDKIEQQAIEAPYLLYDAVDDGRTRPAHRAWDGTILPVNSNFWHTHTPPCGYNCRCTLIQLDKNDLDSLGLNVNKKSPPSNLQNWTNPRTGKVEQVAAGVDPGFGRLPSERIGRINKIFKEKKNSSGI